MFGFFKKKEVAVQENRLFKRLVRISNYCNEFVINSADKINVRYSSNNQQHFYFQSALGTVEIELCRGYFFVQMNYANYAGTTVFNICSNSCKNEVTPLLGEDLTAHDIDLAILELEEYLNATFGDVDEAIKARMLRENEKLAKHEEELRKLF